MNFEERLDIYLEKVSLRTMQRESYIMGKLKGLKEAAWNFPIKDHKSYLFARKYASKTKDLIEEGALALGKEAGETEQMARSFFKLLESKL